MPIRRKQIHNFTNFASPSVKLTLIGARVGGVVGKAIASAVVEGKLSPEILGDALLSSSSLRSHVQAEALRIIAMSKAQYKYETITTAYTLIGTLAGGGVGAALGSLVLPGFGTALGSIVCSTCAGCLPAYWRSKKGPDDESRRQVEQLKSYHVLTASETGHGYVVMSKEDALRCVSAKQKQRQNQKSCSQKNGNNENMSYQNVNTKECKCSSASCTSSSPSSMLNSSAYEEDSFVVFETARNSGSRQRSVGSSSTCSASTSSSTSSSSFSFSSLPISSAMNNNRKVQERCTWSEVSVKESDGEDCNTTIPLDLVQSRMCFQENLDDLHESEELECDDDNMVRNTTNSNSASNGEDANDVNKANMFNLRQVTSFDDVGEVHTSQLTIDNDINDNKKECEKANVSRHSDALMRRIMGGKIEYIEGRS